MFVNLDPTQVLYNHVLDNSIHGFLICNPKEGGDGIDFEVRAINQQARALLACPGQVATPILIEEIVSSAPFKKSMAEVYKSKVQQTGLLQPAYSHLRNQELYYQVEALGESLVVRLDNPDAANEKVAMEIGKHLQQTNLTCILIFEAVRNELGQIENLRLSYQNQAAIENPALGVNAQVGWLLTDWYPGTKSIGHFSKYIQVIETGESFVDEQYYPQHEQSFYVAVSRCGDGIMLSYYSSTEKQKVIRQARQQAQLLVQIMDSSHDFIMLWEPIRNDKGTIVDFKATQYNQAVLNSGFFREKDFQNLTLRQLSPEAIRFIPSYAEVIESGEAFRIEQPFRKGEIRLWFDVSVTRLNDGALSIFKDITERKNASLRIQAQNKLLENILNSSENAILVAETIRDTNQIIVDLSISKANHIAQAYLEQIFGFDVVGASLMKLTGGKFELFEDFVKVAETGEPMLLAHRYYPPVNKWFKVSAHRIENGIVINYVDVTAIHKSLVEAQRQTEMIQGVLNGSLSGLFAMEPVLNEEGEIEDFKILIANNGATRITGIPLEKLTGNSFLSLFPVVGESAFRDIYRNFLQSDEPIRTEISFPVGEEAHLSWFDVSLTRVNDSMLILSFMNITDRVQLRQEQEKLLEELRRSNLYLEQFAYVASHDLQEPARKIQSFGEILDRQYGHLLPRNAVDIVNRMRSAGSRMQDLIEGLLSYSRFSSQKEVHKIVDLNRVVQNVLQDLDGAIEEKKARIQVGQLPVIKGNVVQLRQLFQNLLSNALKFSREEVDPEVYVEAGPATPEELKATALSSDKPWVAIRVRDNGIGFDETYRDRVFELFVRLHGRSQFVGSGLGLAISKKVVELHGGGITVKSTIGKGTSFSIILPLKD
ncbi:PAS domain-containing sensor histidine kinase [Telluribacter sp.]|jgi:signal transduction histidine kinase|uniref:PAS domain-containing sensor histidine kinase n=1 Tax=Telluribacter sp. TaxID=1978767 RepID=UPI002E0F8CF6|nr:ATP-binding protein [Telluribacter sp.]